jgi:hypothetical protein
LPEGVAEIALKEIDIESTDNIRILKYTVRTWFSELVAKIQDACDAERSEASVMLMEAAMLE